MNQSGRPQDSTGDGAVPVLSRQVLMLGSDAVLQQSVASRAAAEAAEARLLELAVRFVQLHPVTDEHPAATPSRGRGAGSGLLANWETGELLEPGLAGAGTPAVAEFALEELAAVLGLSYAAAWQLAGDALELAYRLPRLWAEVRRHLDPTHRADDTARQVPVWQARVVARATQELSTAAVEFVDRQIAILAARGRMPGAAATRDLVHEAVLRFDDPDRDEGLAEAALASRGVWFDHHASTTGNATTRMEAVLDSWDAQVLDASLSDVAGQLGRLGDNQPHDVRRAEALSLLADPQHVLELFAPTDGDSTAVRRTPGTRINLYVHATLSDLAPLVNTQSASTGDAGCGLAEQVGPTALRVVQSWLGRTDRITLRPVLDPLGPDVGGTDTRPVDRHDPPEPMREHVLLRDGQCVFPGCRRDARACDLDHIEPYVNPDEGGPPGQTHPGNLACLCRRHHRLKTFTAWDYLLLPDGSYRWTSPRGRTFTTFPAPKRGPRP